MRDKKGSQESFYWNDRLNKRDKFSINKRDDKKRGNYSEEKSCVSTFFIDGKLCNKNINNVNNRNVFISKYKQIEEIVVRKKKQTMEIKKYKRENFISSQIPTTQLYVILADCIKESELLNFFRVNFVLGNTRISIDGITGYVRTCIIKFKSINECIKSKRILERLSLYGELFKGFYCK